MGRNRGMGYDRFATIRLGYKPLYILYIYDVLVCHSLATKICGSLATKTYPCLFADHLQRRVL